MDARKASDVRRDWIEIGAPGDRAVRAYLAAPESDSPVPSVVVVHENRGLSEWIRSVGDRLAGHGLRALCPDMLSGLGPNGGGTEDFASGDEAREAIRGLDPAQVTADLRASVAHVRGLAVTTAQVSVAGFCWGGRQAFELAVREPSLAAAYVFYGLPPAREAMGKINCPVYGFYGENDERINATIADAREAMSREGKVYEPVTYADVGHAFLRREDDQHATDAEKSAARLAWARFLELLTGG